MKLTAISSPKIRAGDNLITILDTCLPTLRNKSILAITSKVISLCENAVIDKNSIDKADLIQNEADDYLLPDEDSPHPFYLTIKHNLLIPSAGIDESNSGTDGQGTSGHYILYPKDPFESLTKLWQHLKNYHNLDHLGLIMTDSHTTPLRRGVTGIGLAWCGFKALKNYVGTEDCFGRPLSFTQRNNVDGLAAAAVFMMGEGNEQTPFCLIENLESIVFTENFPSVDEKKEFLISVDDDLYSHIFKNLSWRKKISF